MTVKGRGYWWKDKSGKWHFEANKVAHNDAVETSQTKPSNIPANVTPTKPAGGATTQLPTKPKPTLVGTSTRPVANPVTSTTGEVSSRSAAKAALAKVGLEPNENAKAVWKSGSKSVPKATQVVGTKKSGSKAGGAKKASLSSLSGVSRSAGQGRAQVDSGQGSRKVYDDAKSRLIKKRKGYRP